MKRRELTLITIVALALLGAGCSETNTPTEPVSLSATPTPIPGLAASMTGSVTWGFGYGSEPGAVVECQGRSTTSAKDGTYTLGGLMSGPAEVTIRANNGNDTPVTVEITLKPGSNSVNLDLG